MWPREYSGEWGWGHRPRDMEGWDGVFVRETGGVEPSVGENEDIEGVE